MTTNNEEMTPLRKEFLAIHSQAQSLTPFEVFEIMRDKLLAATAPRPFDETAEREAFRKEWPAPDFFHDKEMYYAGWDQRVRWDGWISRARHAASVGVQPSTASVSAQGQMNDLEHAAWLLESYAAYLRSEDFPAKDLERHPYIPEIEQAAERLRATQQPATAAQGEPVAWVNVEANRDHTYHGIKELPEGRHCLYAEPPAAGREVPDVDWLANVIRTADGSNTLGAGALAEKIRDAMLASGPQRN